MQGVDGARHGSQVGKRPDEPVRRQHRSLRLVVEKIPLFVLAAASCVVTLAAQRDAMRSLEQLAFSWRVANAAVAYVAYLGKMFYPADLAVLYPLPKGPPPAWEVVAAVAVLLAISTAVFVVKAEVPLLALRVALVSWDTGAGDRIGAGGRPGDGRPLHVFDADRALHGDCLGRRGRWPARGPIVVGRSRPSRRWWWQG